MGFIGSFTDNGFKYLFGSYIYIIYLIILCYPIILLFNINIKYKNYIFSILFLLQLVFEIIFYNFNNYNFFDYKYVINHPTNYLGGGIIAFYIVKLLVYLLSYYGTLIIVVSTLLFIILIFINKHYPSFLSSIYDLLKIKNKETVSEINEQDLGTLVTSEEKNTNLENYNNINEKDFEVDMQSFKKDSKSRSNRSLHKDYDDIYNSNTDSIITTETSTYDNYKLPSLNLLMDPIENKSISKEDIVNKSRILQSTFKDFGVEVKIVKAIVGPSITQFQILPTPGTKVSKIVNLSNDIALNLAAKDVRIEAPIPGKSLIGIEIPNDVNQLVTMKEVFVNDNDNSPLNVALGKDVSGNSIFARLDRMPHLLVAGSTGSGKSVCVNTIITSLLMKNKPDKVKLIMIDPKMVELSIYDGIPHLLTPVVTNPLKAADVLHKVVLEMEKRYKEFSIARVKNIEGYNKIAAKDEDYKEFPYIVVIIDELADLMMVASKEVEESIARISQMARAAGIHLIIATQRPSVDVITGVIKTNIPSRIAFSVSSSIDSRTIIDKAGAETLLGKGDMLFQSAESSKPIRVQGAFLSDQEVENIVEYIKSQSDTEYDESMMPSESSSREGSSEETDPLYKEVLLFIAKTQKASASLLQRRFKIGYNRAARIIEMLEDDGYIGPSEGSKPRKVFLEPEFAENNE
ncbi:DNA translocase FtsK [Gemelliphila palaticanis]|uniref:DNA translocase FtsK n=1 Tax=Gemelliphila palaticanis TaxID=81950 RepID=A0ABX2T1Y3_9BACL|nr:DNA translocase FtsK [Gemella palaticanis]NYS47215.1 DNA translocase FtsK [Gemella palaticanis]